MFSMMEYCFITKGVFFGEQDVHMEARNLLSVTLNGLTTFKCIDQYQPSACEPQTSSAEEPMQMEAWLTPRYGDLDAAVRPPQWYVPSTAEVSSKQRSFASDKGCVLHCPMYTIKLHDLCQKVEL